MKAKTWVATAGVLLAATALAGGALAEDKSKTNLKVAIFSVNAASPTIHTMIESATAAAKERGWTVENYDGNGDQVATNNQVNTYITRGFDALINVATLPANGSLGWGRDTQSIVFLSTAVIELLYSGAEIRKPW